MKAEDINSLESEAGVIASLVHRPDLSFFSEHLLPNHFTNTENRLMYAAITDLAQRGIKTVDPYNIIEDLNANEATRRLSKEMTVDKLQEFIEMSDVLARGTVEEYKLLVDNVLDAAFRRDTFQKLKECQGLCFDRSQDDIEHKIYQTIDDVMMEFSTASEVPQYKEVVDDYWEEILDRQSSGFSGIPFKFPTLNYYATIEPGELFVFGAEAKQGKSMMLLNCAIDLLRQDLAVLYLDSELNSRLFTARVLSHLSGVEYRRLTTGNYNEEEAKDIAEALAWMKTRKLTHIYLPSFDEQTIYTTVKKVKHTQGIDVLVIDYFKSGGDGDAFNTYQELGRLVDTVNRRPNRVIC